MMEVYCLFQKIKTYFSFKDGRRYTTSKFSSKYEHQECNILKEERGSYMSAHVLLNLLNELGKSDKMRGLPSLAFYRFCQTSTINSTKQEYKC